MTSTAPARSSPAAHSPAGSRVARAGRAPVGAAGRQQPQHGGDQQRDDGRVHQEDRPPSRVLGQDPAEHDAGARPGRGRALVDAERAGPGGTVGEQVGDRRQGHRGDQGGARPLREPGADKHARVRCQPGGQGRHAEQREPKPEQPPVPGEVADPPAEQQQGTKRKRVPRNDPLQVRGGHGELALDRGERHVDDREVKLEGELRRRHQEQRQAELPPGDLAAPFPASPSRRAPGSRPVPPAAVSRQIVYGSSKFRILGRPGPARTAPLTGDGA